MTLGERIGEARRRTGLSQAQVAERLDVSRQAVSKWETDASRPDTENLLRLAELFATPLEELAFERPEGAAQARPCPKWRERLVIAAGVCEVLLLLLFFLHWGPVALEAGGTSWDSPDRAQAYARKVFDKYEEAFMAWALAHAMGMEDARLLPDSLSAAWSGRELSVCFQIGPGSRGESAQVEFQGRRVWPGIFRWEEQKITLIPEKYTPGPAKEVHPEGF